MTNSPVAGKGHDRFSKVALDPRFKKIRRKETKINVDPRFKKMFTQKEFQTTAKYDKYGRKLVEDAKSHGKKELERFYHLASSDQEEEDLESNSKTSEDESSSSSDENALTFSEGEEICLEHPLAQDQDEIPHGNRTKRLALTNLDWDFIKAQDLFKLFDSFKPPTASTEESSSSLLSVKIYKSQFGKERMELENKSGPALEILPLSSKEQSAANSLSNVAAESEEDPIESEASQRACQISLKRYKLERLRYFFAVVECASVEHASLLYDKCDGIEFEKSSNFLDLRFVPDDLTFEQEDLHEEFNFSNAISSASTSYCPKDFTSSASSLQCTTQKLAWDEDDVLRSRITKRNISKDHEILEEDYAAFVASCSSEDENDEHEGQGEGRISKYRSILADSEALNRKNPFQKDTDKWQEMEVVFDSGLEGVAVGGGLFDAASKQQESEQIVQETPFEKQLRKGRERRRESKQKAKEKAKEFAAGYKEMPQPELSREQLAALCSNSGAADWEKDGKNVAGGWKPNVSDERFSAILESADYALDPTHPAFKSTECNLELMKRKRKKANRE